MQLKGPSTSHYKLNCKDSLKNIAVSGEYNGRKYKRIKSIKLNEGDRQIYESTCVWPTNALTKRTTSRPTGNFEGLN